MTLVDHGNASYKKECTDAKVRDMDYISELALEGVILQLASRTRKTVQRWICLPLSVIPVYYQALKTSASKTHILPLARSTVITVIQW